MFQIDNIREMFFSWEGRLNRKPYILRCLTLGLIMMAIYILLMVIAFTTAAAQMGNGIPMMGNGIPMMGNGIPMMGAFGATYILYLPFIISGYLLAIRRLHDLDLSAFFILLSFVPVVSFFFALYLIFKKGTEGPNSYGPDPLSTDPEMPVFSTSAVSTTNSTEIDTAQTDGDTSHDSGVSRS